MFRGNIIDLPCGRGGLDGNQNPYLIPLSSLTIARNIRFDGFVFRKAGGMTLFDTVAVSGAPVCFGGIDWRPEVGAQNQVTVFNDGKVYKETGDDIDAVTLHDFGGTLTHPVSFVEGGNTSVGADKELYIFTKGYAPQKLVGTGVTTSNFTAESADWTVDKPGAGIKHDFRTVAFDVDGAPHNFYLSTLNDTSDFVGSGADLGYVFQVEPGVGDKIVAAFSYLPQQLIIFKYPRGIWTIDTTDYTNAFLPTTLIRSDIGLAGPHGVARVGNDIMIISSNGRIYSLQALRPDIDPIEADLTAKLNLSIFIRDNVDANKLQFARLVYDENRKELWYIFTKQGSTQTNNMALVFDMNEALAGNIKTAVEDRGEYFQAVWKRIGLDGFNEILVAGAGGLVYRINQVSRSINGVTGYTAEFRTPDSDFKDLGIDMASRQKVYQMLEIGVLNTGAYTMGFDVYIDGNLKKTLTFNVTSGSGSTFDSSVFDTATFGGLTLAKHRIPIDCVGNQFALRGFNTSANEDFAIIYMRVYFKPVTNTYEE